MVSCTWKRNGKFTVVCLVVQIIILVLFGFFVHYSPEADARYERHSKDPSHGGSDPEANPVRKYYGMFQDIHVMMFVGFGFLMTFLKRYGFGSVGLNMFLAALVIQWSTLISGFLHLHNGYIEVSIIELITGDFAAATVLISFGAMLGKLSPTQMLVMAIIEVVIFNVNEWIGLSIFEAVDVGGSMFVHVFGAYFGLAMARVMFTKKWARADIKNGSTYHSDLFAMIGTLFLWMFWPSFNSALAPGDDQQRAVINTYFALAACAVTTFAISSLVEHDKFEMIHIQNSTLAGGVAVGTMADMQIEIWAAILIGMVAGTVSVVGYRFLTPFLHRKLKIHDTCGVHNLHGMPGLIAAIGGILASLTADEKHYGLSLYQIFPARAPVANSTALADIQASFSAVEAGEGRSAAGQAQYQAAALGLTILMALVGGALTGAILRIPIWDPLSQEEFFDDMEYWFIPMGGQPGLPLAPIDGGAKDDSSKDDDIEKNGYEGAYGKEHRAAEVDEVTKV